MRKNFIIFLIVFLAVVTFGGAGLLYIYSQKTAGIRADETANEDSGEGDGGQDGAGRPAGETSLLGEMQRELFVETGKDESGDADPYAGSEREPLYQEFLGDPERMEALNIHPVEMDGRGEFVIDFTGDILFDPSYAIMSNLRQRGGRAEDGFAQNVIDELRSADISVMNNEFPYSDRGAPLPDKMYTFRARPESVSLLNDLGVDLVGLANNHAFDYGESALLDTLEVLKGAGVNYIGAGRDLDEASREITFIAGDVRVAVIAATQIERSEPPNTRPAAEGVPGVFRCWNPGKLLERIEELDAENDVVIVFIHWGTESTAELDWAQLEQARSIADAGADVIVGAHPHVLQGFEYVNGIPVAYSLGNFLFNSKSLDTCILQVRIPTSNDGDYDTSGIKLRVLPGRQQDSRVKLVDGQEKERILTYLNSLSSSAVLDADGYIARK